MDLLEEESDEETVFQQDIDEDDLLGGSDEDEGAVHSSTIRKPIVFSDSSHPHGNCERKKSEFEDEDVLDLALGEDVDELEPESTKETTARVAPVKVRPGIVQEIKKIEPAEADSTSFGSTAAADAEQVNEIGSQSQSQSQFTTPNFRSHSRLHSEDNDDNDLFSEDTEEKVQRTRFVSERPGFGGGGSDLQRNLNILNHMASMGNPIQTLGQRSPQPQWGNFRNPQGGPRHRFNPNQMQMRQMSPRHFNHPNPHQMQMYMQIPPQPRNFFPRQRPGSPRGQLDQRQFREFGPGHGHPHPPIVQFPEQIFTSFEDPSMSGARPVISLPIQNQKPQIPTTQNANVPLTPAVSGSVPPELRPPGAHAQVHLMTANGSGSPSTRTQCDSSTNSNETASVGQPSKEIGVLEGVNKGQGLDGGVDERIEENQNNTDSANDSSMGNPIQTLGQHTNFQSQPSPTRVEPTPGGPRPLIIENPNQGEVQKIRGRNFLHRLRNPNSPNKQSFPHPQQQYRHFSPRPRQALPNQPQGQGLGLEPNFNIPASGNFPPSGSGLSGYPQGPPMYSSFPHQPQPQQQMGPPIPFPIQIPSHMQVQINPGSPYAYAYQFPQQMPMQMHQSNSWNMGGQMAMGQQPNIVVPPLQPQYFQPQPHSSYPDFSQMHPELRQALQEYNVFIPNQGQPTIATPSATAMAHPQLPVQKLQTHESESRDLRDRDRDRDRERDRSRDRDRDYKRERERDYDRDRDYDRGRGPDRDRNRDRDYERDRDYDRGRDRDRDRDGRYSYSSSDYRKRKSEYRRDEYSSSPTRDKRSSSRSRQEPAEKSRRAESREDQIAKIILETQEMGLEVDKAYLDQLEEQKEKRAEVLRLKAEKRRMAMSGGVKEDSVQNIRVNVRVDPRDSNSGEGDAATVGGARSIPSAFKGDLTALNSNLKKINMNVPNTAAAGAASTGEPSRTQQPGPSRQATLSGSSGDNSERPRKILRIVKNKNGEIISKSKVIVMRKQNPD